MSTTQIRAVEHDDGSCPADLHTVFVRDVHYFHKVPHMINIAVVLVDVVAPISQKATAPAFTMVLGDEKHSVRVAIWKDHAANVGNDRYEKGKAVIITHQRARKAKTTLPRLAHRGEANCKQPRRDGRRIARTHAPAC